MAALTLGIEFWAVKTNNPNWQTMVFTVLSLAQLGHVFAIRSEKQYIFKVGFFSNRPLALAVLFTFALQMAVIYLPVANDLLKTKPLPLNDLLVCMLGPVVIFFAVELEKLVRRRRHLD